MSSLSLDKYSSEAKNLVVKSQALADKRNHKQVEPIHFLAVALGLTDIVKLLESADVDSKEMEVFTETQLQSLPKETREPSYLSEAMIDFLKRAEQAAGSQGVTIEHLLHALAEEKKGAALRILQAFGIGPGVLKNRIAAKEKEVKKEEVSTDPSYMRNLTELAKSNRLDPVIGRNAEVRRLLQILGRRNKNHPILVGEVGVGKKSIVNALAMKIASGNVSSKFSSVKVMHLDAGRLVSGVKQRGDVEERMRKALSAIKAEDTILFIHGIDSLFNQSTVLSGSGDLVSSLLARENLRLITSTTPEGLRKLTEKDSNLTRQFTTINVDASTDAETVEILRGIAIKYETFHNVRVGDPAICAAVKLAKRYLQKRALPDSAIDLLDEASSRKKFEVDGLSAKADVTLSRYSSLKNQLIGLIGDDDPASLKTKAALESEIEKLGPDVEDVYAALKHNRRSGGRENCILTEEDIASVLEDWTGIPINSMLEGEGEKLSKMEDILSGRVVGQDEAVKAVAKSVRRARLGLRDLGKPIGSFLMLGPSGVGKTELAKALAKFLFDDDKAMIRMDMSEYMEKHMAQRLIGAPPGYAQADEGGLLTEAVSKKPYSVLLFDEIEKAHPDVFNLLLQVLDDGRLTDGLGKTVDFTNTVVIMTSNIGSASILELPPEQFETVEGVAAIKNGLQADLRKLLRPELLNRIDETVIFRPLTKGMLKDIANIQINLLEKMLSPKEIKLIIDDEAKSFLVEIGYEPGYGARPLKRAILKHVQDALAERIMSGVCKEGSTVNISVKNDALYFSEVDFS
jgi:ATP-dependent Clp protease ATP-binding subunit ClpB